VTHSTTTTSVAPSRNQPPHALLQHQMIIHLVRRRRIGSTNSPTLSTSASFEVFCRSTRSIRPNLVSVLNPGGILEVCLDIVVSAIQKFVTCQVTDQDLNVPPSTSNAAHLPSDGSTLDYPHTTVRSSSGTPIHHSSQSPSSFPPHDFASLYADLSKTLTCLRAAPT
jgi:hypothetical protein